MAVNAGGSSVAAVQKGDRAGRITGGMYPCQWAINATTPIASATANMIRCVIIPGFQGAVCRAYGNGDEND